MNDTISPGPRFFRAFVVSAALLAAVIERMRGRGESLVSVKVGLACCFVGSAFLLVWGAQRITGRRWSWLGVLLAMCGITMALVWLTVAVARAVRGGI